MSNILHSSQTASWYTPSDIIEGARRVLGGIYLDPASCYEANSVVQAHRYYTEREDGLATPWTASTVWLNPPFGKGVTELWARRAIEEYDAGSYSAGIWLFNATPDRRWFQWLWDFPICFLTKRVKFWQPGEEKNSPTHGSVLVYAGDDVVAFVEEFRKVGHIVLPHDERLA